MQFRNQALCLACAVATATAFVPTNTIGMKLSPRDLISPRPKQHQRGIISPTSRYLNTLSDNKKSRISSLSSTLTSDEEASKTAQDDTNQDPPNQGDIPEFPSMNEHGIYDILNADQHNAWLKANPDKLMVIKFFAPWCRACKSVEPKYIQISKDEKYSDIPIIFGQLSVQHNKAYVKSLGIMALPSIQIYAGSEGLVENFPCGPSKIPMLKRKLTDTINAKVDPQNRTLKLDCANPANKEAEPCRTRTLTVLDEPDASNEIDEVISDQRKEENLRYLRTGVPYFKDFDDDEFYDLMDKVSVGVSVGVNVVI
jgi:thiol-disulfide isomerase/thioredoxin